MQLPEARNPNARDGEVRPLHERPGLPRRAQVTARADQKRAAVYVRRQPERSAAYQVVCENLEPAAARATKDGPIAVQTNLHNTENAPIAEV